MIANIRSARHALLVLAIAAAGCGETTEESATVSPPSPRLAPATETGSTPVAPSAPTPPPAASETGSKPDAPVAAPAKEGGAASEINLEKVKWNEFTKRMANKDAKYTLVDAWATWCGPCKENFPHVVEMHKKYSGKGLAVASLSLDDPSEAKQVHDAQEFLAQSKAVMANYLLDEEQTAAFEKLNINGIPAVFIYGPDGKEVKRFTGDDPDNQFTYEEVEETVVALLDGKPLPQPKAKDEAKAKTGEK